MRRPVRIAVRRMFAHSHLAGDRQIANQQLPLAYQKLARFRQQAHTCHTAWSGGRAHPGLSKGQRHDRRRPPHHYLYEVASVRSCCHLCRRYVVAAATADAKPKQTAGQQYDQCIVDAVKYNVDHGTTPDMNLIQGGCCGYIGGTIVTGDDGVTFKDCIFPDAPAGQTTSPPGGTAILHPGDTTRAGDQ
jgi:hypothetical protein